jgi:hypothetical protein
MQGRTRDFDFDPVQLDRFHYFLAALKKEGIGWMLDGLSSPNGAYGDVGGNRWAKKRNLKAGIYHDPSQQAHWKELVSRILGARNKYTDVRIIDDPALFGIILVNEGGLNHIINLDASPEMDRMFEQWLIRRYGSIAAAGHGWGLHGLKGESTTLPRKIWTANPRVIDAQRFYYEVQQVAFQWMGKHIRDLGYEGPITAFDNWPNLQDQATRAHLPWVDMHSYHDQPLQFVRPGSRIEQSSSIEGGLEYVRLIASARYWGKPFTVTEYEHPFWNRWRFESGLAVGAYAAFQNWDLICRHGSGPIELAYGSVKNSRRKAIHPFSIGMDPVARASETLTALLYLRGDVRPSRQRVGIRLSEDYVFDRRGGIGRLPADLTKLSLITGLGLVWSDRKPQIALDAVIEPSGKLPTVANKLAEKVGLGSEQSLAETLAGLRSRGLLAGNKSDGKSLFVSDTGEIVLDTSARVLKVITPRTEAVAFAATPGRLDALTVKKSSGPALVAASSMDGASLDKSGRILLILASDAQNSGMKFADAEERELVQLGGLPVLMRNVSVDLQLRHVDPARLVLYALRLNGERAEKLPLKYGSENSVFIVLDTMAVKHGPTTFFELVLE